MIIWKGSPNKDGNRLVIDRIVMHWFGVGTLDAANTRFQNVANQVSAHYGISNNTVYQWVKEEDVAYHAGNYAMNQRSIGIEHDATTTQPASDETYATSIQLVADICKRHSIPCDRTHIIKHNQVIATQCCGTLDVDRIVSEAKIILDTNSQEDRLEILRKELEYEISEKERFKKLSEEYKATCQSQAEEISKLGEEIKSLNQALAGQRSEIAQLQEQFVAVSRQRDELLSVQKLLDNKVSSLLSENETLKVKLNSKNPLQDYSISDILGEVINRIFRGRK